MPLTKSLIQIALDNLESTVCPSCGNLKPKRKSFCGPCYWKLPKPTRIALYKPMSEGYAEIYDEALDWLKINT